MNARPNWIRPWALLDGSIILYTVLTSFVVLIFYSDIARPRPILLLHGLVIFVILVLPSRGAAWEMTTRVEPAWRKISRGGARFLRYAYPLILVILFFEQVEQTVNAIAPSSPYWFEPKLYAADRWLFGELPVLLMSDWVGFFQDELVHAFYLSYYFIVIGGVALAWFGPSGTSRQPGPGFEGTITSTVLAFLLCFIWYPLLPARGPWENPQLMAGLRPFEGYLFVPTIAWIIERGAVSGGCFPSSHVAGAWATVFGLIPFQRRAALVLGCVAVGMSFACVYTRYHHAVDVPAGLFVGAFGAWIGTRVTIKIRARMLDKQ